MISPGLEVAYMLHLFDVWIAIYFLFFYLIFFFFLRIILTSIKCSKFTANCALHFCGFWITLLHGGWVVSMETCLRSHQLFDASSHKFQLWVWRFIVFIAVTLPPAGQIPKQQSDHFNQEIVGHSQEHQREESQGIEIRVVWALFFLGYFIIYYFMAAHFLVPHKQFVVKTHCKLL